MRAGARGPLRTCLAGTLLLTLLCCGRQAFDPGSGGSTGGPTPTGSGTILPVPSGTPTVVLTTGFVPDTGSGRDGAFSDSATGVVINTCFPVVFGQGTLLESNTLPALSPGERLLIMQVQDLFAVSTNTLPVAVGQMGAAGGWEIRSVDATGSTALTLNSALNNTYLSNPGRQAQACTLPQYTTVTVSGTLVAPEWNGSSGGVLGFFATGLVTLSGTLSASAAGFRGGLLGAPDGKATQTTTFTTTTSLGGGKGEGLDGTSFGLNGKGAMANGGGGGNSNLSGGGGGGNGGSGGLGGLQENGGLPLITQGQGGGEVAVPVAGRLAFGGGGGAGDQTGGDGGAGGRGGGIILVFAQSIIASGTIALAGSNGGTSLSTGNNDDAAGGGGAGGTAWIWTQAVSGNAGTVNAEGGPGGNVTCSGCGLTRGPGGGGGGGRVRIDGVPAATVKVDGGANGTNPKFDNPDGATAGGNGTSEGL